MPNHRMMEMETKNILSSSNKKGNHQEKQRKWCLKMQGWRGRMTSHCGKQCKLVQLLRKSGWKFLKKQGRTSMYSGNYMPVYVTEGVNIAMQ